MANSPDIIAEFVVGPTCPPQSVIDTLARDFGASVPLPGGAAKSLGVCTLKPPVNAQVVSLGVWADAGHASDSALRQTLADSRLITTGHTAAFLMSANLISLLVKTAWAATDKTQGRVTLGSAITVAIKSGKIVTTVHGEYAVPVLPDVDFTYTASDSLSLAPSGSTPPLKNTRSTSVDTNPLLDSILIGLLSPILGAIAFFAADPIAEAQVPGHASVGDALAAQWPPEILTRISPPFLPGKFTLAWDKLIVDTTGVRTLGKFAPATRKPDVQIVGSRSVSVEEFHGEESHSYSVKTRDLRAPLAITWGGQARGHAATARVHFFTNDVGSNPVSVAVRDVDGLSDTAQITVTVKVIPLPPGTVPP